MLSDKLVTFKGTQMWDNAPTFKAFLSKLGYFQNKI
jgi:hypothetical protein